MNAYTAPKAEALRAILQPGETVVAEGSVYEGRRGPFQAASAQKLDYVLVTPARILWAHARPTWTFTLRFEDVSSWGERRFHTHRYVLVLEHPSVERVGWVPKHHLLAFRWGNAEAVGTFDRTVFGFSRGDTAAARAIRGALRARGVPSSTSVEDDEAEHTAAQRGATGAPFALQEPLESQVRSVLRRWLGGPERPAGEDSPR